MPDNNTKSIKFKFELDNQSFQQVQNAVKALTGELQKLGGVMGAGGGAFPGLSIGGAAPNKSTQIAQGQSKAQSINQPTMGKVIVENAQAFKKFANDSKDASKVMTDALKRDIGTQERSLDLLKNKLKDLGKEYQNLEKQQKGFLARGMASDELTNKMGELQGKIAETSGQTLKGAKQLADSKGLMPATSQGGFGGFMQNMGYTGSGFGGGAAGLMKGIAGAIGAAVAVGAFGLNEVREGGAGMFAGNGPSGGQGGMDIRAEARRGQLLNNRIRALRRGDVTQLMVQDEIRRDSNKSAYYDQQIDAIAKAQAYVQGGGEGLAKLPVIKQALGILGKGGGGNGTALEGLTDAEIQSKLLENAQGVEGQVAGSANFLDRQMAFEHFQSTFASRTNAQRVMGLTLEGRKVNGKTVGRFGDLASWAAENQVGTDAYAGNLSSLRMQGGSKFAGSVAGYETLSQAGGYSGFGALASQANRGGNGFDLARAALGGGIATGAGMQLGSMAFGYNALGTTSGEGVLASIQGGIDFNKLTEGQQFNKVQALQGAMGVNNALMSGSLDPATLGFSTLRAKQILGAGASTRAIDYLATKMDTRQMLDIGFKGGAETSEMQVRGVTRSDVRRMYASKFAGALRGEMSDPDTGSAVSKMVKGLESGLTPKGIWKTLSAKERMQAEVAMGTRTGHGGEESQALMEGFFSNVGLGMKGQKLKRGDALGAKLSGVEGAEAERQASEVRRQEQALREENSGGKLEAKLKNTQEAAKAQKDFATNLGGSVDVLVKHLDTLATAIGQAADKINGKAGMKPVKATATGQGH